MDFNHLPLTTEDGTQVNLDALYKIAPSCFTEARDEKTGALRHVVDFKKLRQLLGDNAVEDEPEAYEFTWVGKQAARREAASPINKTLRPVPESSVDWDHTQNIYIEGDNLDALKLLQKSYLGGVKMIYIDPPYNTGNDFVYHDDFHRTQAEEDLEAGNVDELGNRFVKNTETNGKFHSDWCSMMYPRLQLAHSLLKEDGVIFISIDDNEVDNLRKICDEIFGEDNFKSCSIIINNRGGRDYGGIALQHDYIVIYTKSDKGSLNSVEEKNKEFQYYDSLGGFNLMELRNRNVRFNDKNRPNLCYPFYVNPNNVDSNGLMEISLEPHDGFIEVYPAKSNGIQTVWRWGKEEKARKNLNKEIFGKANKNGGFMIVQKYRKTTKMQRSVWDEKEFVNERGTDSVKELFNNKTYFDYPKSPFTIQRVVELGSDHDSIILDFFSGSSTTAQAVMQLNAEDGGHRKFIMVQLPEEIDQNSEAYKAGYKNICELGEERIRRAGKKIKEKLQGAALVAVRNGKSSQGDLFEQGNQQADGHKGRTLQADDLDTGFRVFRVDSSNMKDVYFAPKDLEPQQLDLFADNVKEDRTELDLLYGCMVDWGVPLSLPLTKETIDAADGHTLAKDNGTIADGHKGRALQFLLNLLTGTADALLTNLANVFVASLVSLTVLVSLFRKLNQNEFTMTTVLGIQLHDSMGSGGGAGEEI